MFRRIQSLVSPMSAMRIDPLTAYDLEGKLHLNTEYLVNSEKQFDTWMELQTNNKLHLCLMEIYEKAATQSDILSE